MAATKALRAGGTRPRKPLAELNSNLSTTKRKDATRPPSPTSKVICIDDSDDDKYDIPIKPELDPDLDSLKREDATRPPSPFPEVISIDDSDSASEQSEADDSGTDSASEQSESDDAEADADAEYSDSGDEEEIFYGPELPFGRQVIHDLIQDMLEISPDAPIHDVCLPHGFNGPREFAIVTHWPPKSKKDKDKDWMALKNPSILIDPSMSITMEREVFPTMEEQHSAFDLMPIRQDMLSADGTRPDAYTRLATSPYCEPIEVAFSRLLLNAVDTHKKVLVFSKLASTFADEVLKDHPQREKLECFHHWEYFRRWATPQELDSVKTRLVKLGNDSGVDINVEPFERLLQKDHSKSTAINYDSDLTPDQLTAIQEAAALSRKAARRAWQARYRSTPEGKAYYARYRSTPEGKAAMRRSVAKYRVTPAGKATKARYQAKANVLPKTKAAVKKYRATPKGKAMLAKYRATPNGKASIKAIHKRFAASEKGKISIGKKLQKRKAKTRAKQAARAAIERLKRLGYWTEMFE